MIKWEKINGKRFSRDAYGVSSVIGVVLMMMLVVMITSVIAAFVFDAVTGEKQSPCAEMVVKNAEKGEQNITIVHYGGDRINLGLSLNNIEIKYNGQVCNRTNITPSNPADAFFDLGEKLEVNVTYGATGDPTRNFTAGDSICIVYKPADCILQRVMVV